LREEKEEAVLSVEELDFRIWNTAKESSISRADLNCFSAREGGPKLLWRAVMLYGSDVKKVSPRSAKANRV